MNPDVPESRAALVGLAGALTGAFLLGVGAELFVWVLPKLGDGRFLQFKTVWPLAVCVLGTVLLREAMRHIAGPDAGANDSKGRRFLGRLREALERVREGNPTRLILLLVAMGLAFRLSNLMDLPGFLDEAAFVVYAWMARDGYPWVGLKMGGKLLFIWLVGIVAPGFQGDLLVPARVVSALMGGVGIGATYGLGRLLYGGRTALLAGGLFAISPFMVFNDRLGTMDGTLSTFLTACLGLSIAGAKRPSRMLALLEGAFMGLAALSKMPGMIALFFPLWVRLSLGVTGYPQGGSRLWIWRYAPALLLASPMAWLFRGEAVRSFTNLSPEASGDWFSLWSRNAKWIVEWLGVYWTAPVIVLGILAIVLGVARKDRRVILLGGASVAPFLIFGLIARLFFPRYVLFATAPWLVLAAAGLMQVAAWIGGRIRSSTLRASLAVAGGIILCAPAIQFDIRLALDPLAAPLPAMDRWQYIEGWPSGYGMAETIGLLQPAMDRSLRDLAVVVNQERSDNFIYGLGLHGKPRPPVGLYLVDRRLPYAGTSDLGSTWGVPERHVGIHIFNLTDASAVPALRDLAEHKRTYVLLSYEGQDPFTSARPGDPGAALSKETSVLQQAGARRLRTFSKPGGFSHYEVWGFGRTAE